MIDKYKKEQENRELNDKRDIRMKSRMQEAQQNAIWEMQNEFSVVTESQNENLASHYTPLLSDDDLDSVYKKKGSIERGTLKQGSARFRSEHLAKSDNDNESERSGSHMQIESNNEVMKSQKLGVNPKGLLDIND